MKRIRILPLSKKTFHNKNIQKKNKKQFSFLKIKNDFSQFFLIIENKHFYGDDISRKKLVLYLNRWRQSLPGKRNNRIHH